jgi:hypothetical protein
MRVDTMGRKIGQYIGTAALCLAWLALGAIATGAVTEGAPGRAFFSHESASKDVHYIADWVVDSGDNRGLAFVIVDKTNAKVFVFDAGGRIRGAAPVLLGLTRGDESVAGIGERALSDIPPEERTTPAGRFIAEMGRNFNGVDVVWVDYSGALSMHRVITNNPKERRLQRLATPTSADNRISWGCINVPAGFFDAVISPAFTGTKGIVYVLPETRPVRSAFGSYDVDKRKRQEMSGHAGSR